MVVKYLSCCRSCSKEQHLVLVAFLHQTQRVAPMCRRSSKYHPKQTTISKIYDLDPIQRSFRSELGYLCVSLFRSSHHPPPAPNVHNACPERASTAAFRPRCSNVHTCSPSILPLCSLGVPSSLQARFLHSPTIPSLTILSPILSPISLSYQAYLEASRLPDFPHHPFLSSPSHDVSLSHH